MKKLSYLLLALCLPLTSILAQSGQAIIRILEDATGAALEGASVSIPGLSVKESTDRSGRLVLRDLPAGDYQVMVRYRGLPDATEFFSVEAGETTGVPIRMGADETIYELEGFTVVSRITSEDIAQQMQRDALNVMNIVASDTVGQLPDRTVADAVRRLPGLSVERSAGQTQNEYVTIRGLYSDFNKVTVDGVGITISNADGASRSVPLNVVSSSVADQIEVTKSATPEMDGDAIGGTINIRTKNAFDYGGRHSTAEFTLGYNDQVSDFSGDPPVDDYFPSFNFTYSDFLNEAETLGFNISANYSKDSYIVSEVNAGGYRLNNGLFFPGSVDITEVLEDVERLGLSTSLDWRPDESTTFQARYSFSRTDTEFTRQRESFFNDSFFNPPVTNDGENFTNFLYDGFVDKSVAYFEDRQDVHVLSLSLEKELDQWKLTGNTGFNYSNYEEDPDNSFRGTLTQFNPVVDFEFDARDDSNAPTVTNPGFDPNDIDNFDALLSADQITFDITDTEFSFGGDAERDFEIAGQTVKFKTGAKARLRDRDFDVKRRSFGFNDIFGNPAIPGLVENFRPKSRVDGEYDGTFYLDPDNFLDFVNQLEADGDITQRSDDILRKALSTYEAEENIYAGYLQGTTEFGKLTILGGVRLEYTDVEFESSRVDFVNGTISPNTDGNDYLDILPGVHFRYDATDDFIVRASVNKTLARASYRQLNPSIRFDPGESDLGGDIIESGNIDLDPTESWNFDLGFDYYYSNAGYLSIGVFAKFMENNIYERNRFVGRDEIIDFQNADSAEVYGLEFLVDQRFDFLPTFFNNFGGSVNVTLVDAEVDTGLPGRGDDTPLFGQVETAVNLALYYRDEKFRARLSYNWTDDYLLVGGIDADDERLDEFADAYGTLDFSMGYYITDDIEIFFEADNLTNEANRGYFGSEDRLSFNSFKGTTYFVGANWKL